MTLALAEMAIYRAILSTKVIYMEIESCKIPGCLSKEFVLFSERWIIETECKARESKRP